jgi:hypothetical protein
LWFGIYFSLIFLSTSKDCAIFPFFPFLTICRSLTTSCQLWWVSPQVAVSDPIYHSLPFMESLSISSHTLSFKREYIISYTPKKSAMDKARNREARISSWLRTNHWLSGIYLKQIGKRVHAGFWFYEDR